MESGIIEKYEKMSSDKKNEFIKEFMKPSLKIVNSNTKEEKVSLTVRAILNYDDDKLLENLTEFVNR